MYNTSTNSTSNRLVEFVDKTSIKKKTKAWSETKQSCTVFFWAQLHVHVSGHLGSGYRELNGKYM